MVMLLMVSLLLLLLLLLVVVVTEVVALPGSGPAPILKPRVWMESAELCL